MCVCVCVCVCVCSDGVGRTGAFLAIHAMVERVNTENVVDFFQFIKSSRIHRADLVMELVRKGLMGYWCVMVRKGLWDTGVIW